MLKHFFSSQNNTESQKIGANTHVLDQINSLQIEKDILTKTISRLYDDDAGLTKIQRDKLLLRYQHQLGVIIARIEKLELVSKHPDLGPLGEGLITLMDQKLSQLDQRLYELTSKIKISEEQKQNNTKKISKNSHKTQESTKIQKPDEKTKAVFEKPITNFAKKIDVEDKFEITTLTPRAKLDTFKQTKYDQMLSQLDSDVITPPRRTPESTMKPKQDITIEKKSEIQKPEIIKKPNQPIQLPEEPEIDDEDDDIQKIKSNIVKTLEKIEQAEVD